MAWFILIVGGLCEVGWLIGLKYSEGFTRLLPSIVTMAFMGASIGCLGLAVKSIPIGTAYAAWTGTSIAAAAALGIYLFDEPTTLLRLVSIGLIILGIIGLRLEFIVLGTIRCRPPCGRPALKNSSPTSRAA